MWRNRYTRWTQNSLASCHLGSSPSTPTIFTSENPWLTHPYLKLAISLNPDFASIAAARIQVRTTSLAFTEATAAYVDTFGTKPNIKL